MIKQAPSSNNQQYKLSGEGDPLHGNFSLLPYFLFAAAYVILLLLSLGLPFFDDTIIFSQQARYFFEHDAWMLKLPDAYYTGNPELFPLYLSWIWRIFGQSLAASHLAMLPVVLVFTWQVFLLVKRFLPEKVMLPALLFIFIDPTIQAQVTMFSKSFLIATFFLMAINQIFSRNNFWMGFALFILLFTNITGMILIVAVLLTDLLISAFIIKSRQSLNLQTLKPYLFVSLALFIYILYAQLVAERTPYAFPDLYNTYNFSSFKGVLMNGLQFDQNLIDYGRAGYWVFIIIYALRWGARREQPNTAVSILAIAGIATAAIMELSVIFYDVAIKARYFLPLYVLFPMLFFSMLAYGRRPFILKRKLVIILAAIILVSGHLWIFPGASKRDWDASHGWLPWRNLAYENIQYYTTENDTISSLIPYNLNKAAFLEDDLSNFQPYRQNQSNKLLIYNVHRHHKEIMQKLKKQGWVVEEMRQKWWVQSFLLKQEE